MSVEDVDRAQSISEALEDIDSAIEEARDVVHNGENRQIREMGSDALLALREERRHLVEQLEEIGLEDPDL